MDIKSIFDLSSEGWMIKLIAAIAVLLIGLIAARIISKLITKILSELEVNRILKEQAGVKIPIEEFVSSLVKYLIYFIAIIWALTELGLQTVILYIILAIVLVILVSFIVLAFKDFIPNITAGFFLHQKNIIKKGDIIKVKDIEGQVMDISLVETTIKSKGDMIYVPNSVLTKNEIIKKSKKSKK
ncbi:MAG: mechanosensitive ion channel [Nanoarchaeota archaeon]|nr:mechanosensitive ion channel [Nanoarchaeota archaeon]MCG2718388.1 mechanosensitive ion channel [Nanoarchaeota archaeon]